MIIRIDRAGSPNVYADNDYELEIGKAIETMEGTDAYIISCGSNLYECLMASKAMKEKYGASIGILDMHTIKPLDTEAILRVAQKAGNIVTVEDHSINGALAARLPRCCVKQATRATSSASVCRTSLRFSVRRTISTIIMAWIATASKRPSYRCCIWASN